MSVILCFTKRKIRIYHKPAYQKKAPLVKPFTGKNTTSFDNPLDLDANNSGLTVEFDHHSDPANQACLSCPRAVPEIVTMNNAPGSNLSLHRSMSATSSVMEQISLSQLPVSSRPPPSSKGEFTPSEFAEIAARQRAQIEKQCERLVLLRGQVHARRLLLSQHHRSMLANAESAQMQTLRLAQRDIETRIGVLRHEHMRYVNMRRACDSSVIELQKAHSHLILRREALIAWSQRRQHLNTTLALLQKLPSSLGSRSECDILLIALQNQFSTQPALFEQLSQLVQEHHQWQCRARLLSNTDTPVSSNEEFIDMGPTWNSVTADVSPAVASVVQAADPMTASCGSDVAARVVGRYSPPANRRSIPIMPSNLAVTSLPTTVSLTSSTVMSSMNVTSVDSLETLTPPKVMRRANEVKYAHTTVIRDTYLSSGRRDELVRQLRESAEAHLSQHLGELHLRASQMSSTGPPPLDSGVGSLQNSSASSESPTTGSTTSAPPVSLVTTAALSQLPPPSPPSESLSQQLPLLALPPLQLDLVCPTGEELSDVAEEDEDLSDSLSQQFSDSLSGSPTIAAAEVERPCQHLIGEEGSVKALQRHHHRFHDDPPSPEDREEDSLHEDVPMLSIPSNTNTKSILRRRNSTPTTSISSTTSKERRARIRFHALVLLLDASLSGDLELVRSISAEMPDVSEPNEDGITALHNAICANHVEISRFLIQECAADVNAQEADGWTPLHCAASCNSLVLCRMLVESGAALLVATTGDRETALEKCTEQQDATSGSETTCEEYLRSQEEYLWSEACPVVYAAFNYTAGQPGELSLVKNQTLNVVQLDVEHEAGWFLARCVATGEVGLVPKCYVSAFPLVLHREWDLLRASAATPEHSVC